MKRSIILTLSLLIISQWLLCQNYLSAGFTREFDGLKIQGYGERIFGSSYHEPNFRDYYSIQYDHQKNGHLFSASVSGFHKSLNTRSVTSNTYYYGSGPNYSRTTSIKDANVRLNYLGVYGSVNKVFFCKNKINLIVGPFLELDFKVSEKESGHRDSTFQESVYQQYNPSTQQVEFYHDYYYDPVSTDPFDALVCATMMTIGVNVKVRFMIQSLFIEPSYSFGVFSGPTYKNVDTAIFPGYPVDYYIRTSSIRHQFGLRFGYLLPQREK